MIRTTFLNRFFPQMMAGTAYWRPSCSALCIKLFFSHICRGAPQTSSNNGTFPPLKIILKEPNHPNFSNSLPQRGLTAPPTEPSIMSEGPKSAPRENKDIWSYVREQLHSYSVNPDGVVVNNWGMKMTSKDAMVRFPKHPQFKDCQGTYTGEVSNGKFSGKGTLRLYDDQAGQEIKDSGKFSEGSLIEGTRRSRRPVVIHGSMVTESSECTGVFKNGS